MGGWAEAEAVGKGGTVECDGLQADDGMDITNHTPTTIRGGSPDETVLYNVACDTYFLTKNPVFKEYCRQYPERIPPSDAGRPLLPILVEFFCKELWRKLAESFGADLYAPREVLTEKLHSVFLDVDKDGDAQISIDELLSAMNARLGQHLSSNII